ncbi:MAG: hypothetical protein H0W25_03345 [Acidimicrobiia bacterium]|nr:hypothetical protein [Acidimicrobiia bacterium]
MSNHNANHSQNGNGAKGQQGGRNRRPQGAKSVDLWGPVPVLSDAEPIVVVGEPDSVLRSLGDPPLQGRSVVAGHYLAAVADRASKLASALAAAAGRLAGPPADDA